MKQKIIDICKCILVFLIVVILGFLAILITYSLPNQKVRENVATSVDTFEEEGMYMYVIKRYATTRLDNYTDAIILDELYFSDNTRSIAEKAMAVYTNRIHNKNPVDSIVEEIQNSAVGTPTSYARYWHGNLVVLKPLFMFFDCSSIKIFNCFGQVLAVLLVIKLMAKNQVEQLIFPFVISILLMNPITIALSLQFSSVFYMTMFALIILLQFKRKLFANKLLPYYFLITGMLTSYFDFLTFPLLTLAFPLILMLFLDDEISIKKNIQRIIGYSLLWIFGYLGMWAAKWVISSIILHENVLEDAFKKIIYRTSATRTRRIDVIKLNFRTFHQKVYKLIFRCIGIYYLVRLIFHRKDFNLKKCILKIIPFLMIAIMPIAWYFIASNHSQIHCWFTYRTAVIFFFAIMAYLEECLRFEKQNQ